MKIAVSPYRLERLVPKSYRQGALLRITLPSGCPGYADCHPWVELGDAPLSRQLALLAQGVTTPLSARALAVASQDAAARERQLVLLDPHKVPLSHWLTSDLFTWTPADNKRLVKAGYRHLKIKVGRDVKKEIPLLKALFPCEDLKLRLDFNENLTLDQFERYLDMIGPLLSHLDFIEDPFPFAFESWGNIQRNYALALACDRQAPAAIGYPHAAAVLILKPALHDPLLFKGIASQRVVVTSYAGHPLDQVATAYFAAEIDPLKKEQHGLNSHHIYAPIPYSKNFSWHSPTFSVPEGQYGFGFEHLLTREFWEFIS